MNVTGRSMHQLKRRTDTLRRYAYLISATGAGVAGFVLVVKVMLFFARSLLLMTAASLAALYIMMRRHASP